MPCDYLNMKVPQIFTDRLDLTRHEIYRLVMRETTRKKRECQGSHGAGWKKDHLKFGEIYNIYIYIYRCLWYTHFIYCTVHMIHMSYLKMLISSCYPSSPTPSRASRQTTPSKEVRLHFYMAWNLVTTTSYMLDVWNYFDFFFFNVSHLGLFG